MKTLLLCLYALVASFATQEPQQPPAQAQQPQTAGGFVVKDVWVDAGVHTLGAWQFEFAITGNARIVSLEGGDHAAFAAAPYYDPAALQKGRIVVAAFSTDAALPTGRTRVARLHLLVDAGVEPRYAAVLQACADGDGKVLDATVAVQ